MYGPKSRQGGGPPSKSEPGEPPNPPPLKTLLAPDQPVPRKDTTGSAAGDEEGRHHDLGSSEGRREAQPTVPGGDRGLYRPLAVVVPAPYMWFML